MTDKAKSLPAVEWQAHNSGARLRSLWCDAYHDGRWTICNADGTERLAEGKARGGLAGAKRAVEERLTWPREMGKGDTGTLAKVTAERDHLKRREQSIIEACERVADGGQYRADIVSAIQSLRRDRDAARAECAAWRTVTGADTPEALAAELAAYRASVRHGARHA